MVLPTYHRFRAKPVSLAYAPVGISVWQWGDLPTEAAPSVQGGGSNVGALSCVASLAGCWRCGPRVAGHVACWIRSLVGLSRLALLRATPPRCAVSPTVHLQRQGLG